jgi:hypothetical protein
MSLAGQSRHLGGVPVTSGLPPIPDIFLRRNNSRCVPTGDIRSKEAPTQAAFMLFSAAAIRSWPMLESLGPALGRCHRT